MTHVKNNSGNKEWYTPPYIIEMVNRIVGSVDLDPASSHEANKIVRAQRYFTLDDPDQAFREDWSGLVFMNPPYGQPDIVNFTDRFLDQLRRCNIYGGITLTNNATETRWFQRLARASDAICFPARRIKYLDTTLKEAHTPLQGQAIMFFVARSVPDPSPKVLRFINTFSEIGLIVQRFPLSSSQV